MANMVSRRVTFVKMKKSQMKMRPKMEMTIVRPEGEAAPVTTSQFVPVERPEPPPRSMWKMALIPLVMLVLVGGAFTMAMNMGDNIRSSNVIDARTDRSDFDVRADRTRDQASSYEDRASSADLESRKAPTDKSFLATHYAGTAGRAVEGGGRGNGGAPASSKGKSVSAPEKPVVNCNVSGATSATLAQGLGDCLSKQK